MAANLKAVKLSFSNLKRHSLHGLSRFDGENIPNGKQILLATCHIAQLKAPQSDNKTTNSCRCAHSLTLHAPNTCTNRIKIVWPYLSNR